MRNNELEAFRDAKDMETWSIIGDDSLPDETEWRMVPVEQAGEAVDLLKTWQTWLGADRFSCDSEGKKLWDRIERACDAINAAPTPPKSEGCDRNAVIEECLQCYSPDDSATDWADKIRRLKL